MSFKIILDAVILVHLVPVSTHCKILEAEHSSWARVGHGADVVLQNNFRHSLGEVC